MVWIFSASDLVAHDFLSQGDPQLGDCDHFTYLFGETPFVSGQQKIDELKTKYKDDRQKQNQEMMQLFRTHKVNPMGGCLPMLLQFPVYIALYKVLWNAIELYHAPFLVYADLSAPDPYFVSPILLGINQKRRVI